MKLRSQLAVVFSLLLAVVAGGRLANAQGNPLEVNKPPTGQNTGGASPLAADPGTKVGTLFVPDYIKPGARLVYSGGSSTESDDPTKPPSAATGLTRFDVVAVTETHVLLIQATYLNRTGAGWTFAAANPVRVNAMEVIGGTALWTSKEALEAMRTHPDMKVLEDPFEINGTSYDTLSYTRIDPQNAMRRIFDKGTGLKLVEQLGVGPAQRAGDPTGFNRKTNSQMQFQTYREVPLPWLGAEPPAWAKTVKAMRFQGTQTLSIPNGQPVAIPFTMTVRFQERGADWAVGTSTVQMQGQSETTSPIITGAARVGAYWMSPAALSEMQQGVIDEDPALGVKLSYAVRQGNMGRFGVLSEEGPGYQLIWGYNLDDGSLVYAMQHNAELNLTLELGLAGRE